ncbi:MCP four helix bundle domain-containing protein [Roseomonas harenae]|uniref:MCP four helix bundle domain-containing protein n=1 Tax=Muricoccus harenae TaxID=2692566 RepID=UPI0038B48329
MRGKLLAAFGLIFVLILGLGGMSAAQLQFINGNTRDLRDNWMPSIQALGELKLLVSRERTRAARVMGTSDPAQRQAAPGSAGGLRTGAAADGGGQPAL